jgi:hypothetical protein
MVFGQSGLGATRSGEEVKARPSANPVHKFQISLLESNCQISLPGARLCDHSEMFFPRVLSRNSIAICLSLLIADIIRPADASLLAYEPFTNAPGSNIIGSGDGFGFSGTWQSNSSGGVATNTSHGLSYTDAFGNALNTSGGAGFFQGLTSANTSMQPIRLFSFARGTNGTDGATTWISFLAVRQGPTVAGSNPYPRGANVPHDINSGALQKLAIGNSSGAASNTVGLIPQGSSGNLKPSSDIFSTTNFIVVRIDHVAGSANDNAYLFVNPSLASEPALSQADTNSIGAFDFSFDRLRVFAGGNASASQPYAELIMDEYRLGETFADVTPHTSISSRPVLMITNTTVSSGKIVLSGIGGSNSATALVLAATNLLTPFGNWSAVGSNSFDANGNFVVTSSIPAKTSAQFYRVSVAPATAEVAPKITTQPTNQTVVAGQTASFIATASGTDPLNYQWYFNTNTPVANGTSSTLTLTNVQATNDGSYFLIVANAAGSATSSVATLTVLLPPTITSQPASQSVTASNDATFSVTANGTARLEYQWYFNTNTLLAGATNTSLAITNAQFADAGFYSVLVTNNYGAVTSSFAQLTVSPNGITNGAYFVATNGSDSNPGTIDQPFLSISKGLSAVGSSGQLYIRGGVYALSSKLSLSKTASPTNRIRMWAYPGETPVIDSTGNSSDGVSISGDCYHLKGITVMLAGHNGINISGASNIVELCVTCSNANTGLHITGDTNTSYNLILNCDSYHNYDAPTHGQNADGFTAKWIFGPGNIFSGCRSWENADDGWDLWMGTNTVIITNCWSFRNGTNIFGDTAWQGNGNGFKLGGNYVGTPHRLVRSLAFLNMANGVDQNNNIAGQTLDNDTAWANHARNFSMAHGTNTTPHVIRNNISFAGASSDAFTSGTLFTNNSWQVLSPGPSASDFQSVDYSGVTAPRQSDGGLPNLPFLKPVLNGRLIDKGVDTGDPYLGAAPDLGAFEVQ